MKIRVLSHQIENNNKKIEIMKRSQREILELNGTVIQMEKSPKWFNKFEQA